MAQIRETELDARALARALWRWSWLLLLLAALAGAATYAVLSRVEPLYTADASILIEERESPLTRPREQSATPVSDFDESAILSQVEVVKSRDVAEAVIDKLDLTRRPEFDPARRPSILDSLLVMLGFNPHPAESSIRQRVMDSYYERVSVFPLQNSRVIGVEFEAPSSQLAAEVANTIAETFVDMQQQGQR
jgi:succinoglycan biosynthesis transport protein ExoP